MNHLLNACVEKFKQPCDEHLNEFVSYPAIQPDSSTFGYRGGVFSRSALDDDYEQQMKYYEARSDARRTGLCVNDDPYIRSDKCVAPTCGKS